MTSVPASLIAAHFAVAYYETLHASPSEVHGFYTANSVVIRPVPPSCGQRADAAQDGGSTARDARFAHSADLRAGDDQRAGHGKDADKGGENESKAKGKGERKAWPALASLQKKKKKKAQQKKEEAEEVVAEVAAEEEEDEQEEVDASRTLLARGVAEIAELIEWLEYDDCSVHVDSVDGQYLYDGSSVVVQVTGTMSNQGWWWTQPPCAFAQTFVLVKEDEGQGSFVVANDIMRFVGVDEEEAEEQEQEQDEQEEEQVEEPVDQVPQQVVVEELPIGGEVEVVEVVEAEVVVDPKSGQSAGVQVEEIKVVQQVSKPGERKLWSQVAKTAKEQKEQKKQTRSKPKKREPTPETTETTESSETPTTPSTASGDAAAGKKRSGRRGKRGGRGRGGGGKAAASSPNASRDGSSTGLPNGVTPSPSHTSSGNTANGSARGRRKEEGGLSRDLFVGDLPAVRPTESEMIAVFGSFGKVVEIDFVPNKPYCFVRYDRASGVQKALSAATKAPGSNRLSFQLGDATVVVDRRKPPLSSSTGGDGNSSNGSANGRPRKRRGGRGRNRDRNSNGVPANGVANGGERRRGTRGGARARKS